jgi:hypothetical protein
MIAGGFLGAYVVERQFWKQVDMDITKSGALLPMMKTLPIIIQLGLLVQIISGIGLLHATEWTIWGQTWLTVKLLLVLWAFLNGLLVGKKLGGKIAAQIFSPSPDKAALAVLKVKFAKFNIMQLILVVAILMLATMFRGI